MRQGFVKVAAVTPKIRVADTGYNAKVICQSVKEAAEAGAKVIVLPELCITGYTCGDLFLQEKLLREAKEELLHIAAFTIDVDAIIFVGLPLAYKGKLYNVAAALNRGKILGIVPKTYLPNYNEFYEARHFTRGMEEVADVRLTEELTVPMGTRQLFTCLELTELMTMQRFLSGWRHFTAVSLRSSLNVPACRTDQKSEVLRYLRVGICVCRPMRVPQYG